MNNKILEQHKIFTKKAVSKVSLFVIAACPGSFSHRDPLRVDEKSKNERFIYSGKEMSTDFV